MLLAGYETTATSLTYCLFVLARHPDEQMKLQAELDSVISEDFDSDVTVFN